MDSNREIVGRSYAAFERGDLDAVMSDMHDEIVWEQAQGLPHGGVYRGLAEVRRAIFDPLHGEWWDEFHAVPAEILEAGESVVVLGRYTGVARGSGKRLDVPYVHVWTLDEGKATRFRQFLDTAGWNDALAPG